ncbi:hypothetical protein PILCRDRAFT_604389 [Piloderma croceum F 1598]|uniref:Uncharacterized protein n=1 Tax=Piloderma croceum (strain F 1598) TaxID=765440 RepID=A0A0C3FDE0_PILCF|nr:hypothetical protein PILCRDRAFT_604389 [Piloderma croceum F 1598]
MLIPGLYTVEQVFKADLLGFTVQVRLRLICRCLESIQLDRSLRQTPLIWRDSWASLTMPDPSRLESIQLGACSR